MIKRSLIKTNVYIRNPVQRLSLFSMTVFSSTGIEGVHTNFIFKKIIRSKGPSALKPLRKSAASS
jgi:hypothetical protein